MKLTLTLEEAKGRTAYGLILEAAQTQQPLIVMLEDGVAVSIQQYQPAAEVMEDLTKLEPLPQFSIGIPIGWKDAIYGKDETGSASADNEW